MLCTGTRLNIVIFKLSIIYHITMKNNLFFLGNCSLRIIIPLHRIYTFRGLSVKIRVQYKKYTHTDFIIIDVFVQTVVIVLK
jgi:hypothetical protein